MVSSGLRTVAAAGCAFRAREPVPRQRRRNCEVIDVGFVLIELKAAFDLVDRHHQTDNRFFQRIKTSGRHLRRRPRRFRREPAFKSAAERVEMRSEFAIRQHPDGAGEMHRLIKPGRNLIRRGVPVSRNVGVRSVHRHQPGRLAVRKLRQRIVARDMKHGARRTVIGISEVERQRGRDRFAAVPRTNGAESARLRKGKARSAIGLEHRRRIHFKLLLDVGAARSDRAFCEGKAADRIRRQRLIS